MNNREKALTACALAYMGLYALEFHRRQKAEAKLNDLQAAVITRAVTESIRAFGPKPRKWWELWRTN